MKARNPSPRAVKILLSAYWGPEGWRSGRVSPDELEYAMSEGVMFAPATVTHDEVVADAKRLSGEIDERAASDAFLASLTSRRLDLRSALGSLHVGRALPAHRFVVEAQEPGCAVCCAFGRTPTKEDLNVLNFERFKWGGVRRLDPVYVAFDLARFQEHEPVSPSTEDLRLGRRALDALDRASRDPNATPRALTVALKDVIPSNEYERRIIVEILSHCGVVQPKSTTPLRDGWTNCLDWPPPPGAKNDWQFPVYAWRGSDGISESAAETVFPQLF